MSLIDVYQIENMLGGESNWTDWLKSPASVAFGFALGLIPAWLARRSEKKMNGELFFSELKSLEGSVQSQISSIKEYTQTLSQIKQPVEQLPGLEIILNHQFDLINSVNKVQLIKYLKNKYGKGATSIVGEKFQVIAIINTEIDRLGLTYEEYQKDSLTFVNEYLTHFNILKRQLSKRRDKIGALESQKDVFMVALWNLIVKDMPATMTASFILTLKSSLHEKLGNEIFVNTAHPLYDAINEFDLNGQKTIGGYQAKKNLFINHLRMTTSTLIDAYAVLYKSNI